MQTTLLQRFAMSAFVAASLSAMTSSATAGSFLRGCASRDMQILKMIEEQETTNALPAEILSDAMVTMMHARIVCHEGYVVDALAIYDAIARSLNTATGSVRPTVSNENPMTQ
jgi:hypothetical protein